MKKLIVALWSVPTQNIQHSSLDQRMAALEKAVARTYELAVQRLAIHHNVAMTERPYALFVAPEYFIAQPSPGGDHTVGDQRHIEEAEKELRLAQLKAMSHIHKGIVFIPGTIAWRKPLTRSGAKLNHSKGPLVGQPKTESRRHKARAAVDFYANRHAIPATLGLSGDKHLPAGLSRPAPTTNQKHFALQDPGLLISLGADYMARNTAYVVLDGNVLLKYNKQGDYHEVLQDDGSTVHIPGRLDGRFQVRTSNPAHRPIDFGIEICLDHVYQTAGKEIPHLGMVDVHIISSAQVRERSENVAVKPGGYLVHACSNSNYTGIKKMGTGWFGGNSLSPERAYHEELIGGCNLLLHEVDLDLDRLKG